MTLENKFEIIKAFEEGKQIEYKWKNRLGRTEWKLKDNSNSWNFDAFEYRIKPKPTRLEVANKLWKDTFGFETFTSGSCPCSLGSCNDCEIGGCSEKYDWWNEEYKGE